MSSPDAPKKDSNLLRWLILVSLLIHIPIFLHMNGLLTTEVLEYIDLTIRKGDESSDRKMLRPPPIFKNKGKPDKAKATLMTPVQLPENSQFYNDGAESIKGRLSNAGTVPLPGANKMSFGSGTEKFSFKEIGNGAGLSSSGLGGSGGALTKEEYIEMVRLKVERNNRFPMEAKKRGGVVTVQFVINLDGTLRNLIILKPSPVEALNIQALKAVRDSAPFRKPPPYIFKKPILIPMDVFFNVY